MPLKKVIPSVVSEIPSIMTDDNQLVEQRTRFEVSRQNTIEQDDNGDKYKKLFVIVSDVDTTRIPSMANEVGDSRLLTVNETKSVLSATSDPREQKSKKLLTDRRRSWIEFPSNFCQTVNLLRLRRARLGQSEPNLRSLSAMKTTNNILPISSVIRRPNLSGFNLINLKNAFRKQSTCQQAHHSAIPSEPTTIDFQPLDDDVNRRWSCTSVPSSSGYGTTSPVASPYASIERLQHQQSICTCKQQWDNSHHGDLQRLQSLSLSMSLLDANLSPSSGKMFLATDQDRHLMTYIYKERYPQAKVQMEERLEVFIETYKSIDKFDYCSDGSARFIHNQLVQLAQDCLEKSINDFMTTFYFNEMTENLERLIINTKDKCPQVMNHVEILVKKLLVIIARSARLLECLQFNPEDFLRTLDEVEYQAQSLIQIKQDIPKYICSKLNLERNPFDAIDDVLRINETQHVDEQETTDGLQSESENESLTDSNYLTITANSTSLLRDRFLSNKGPSEDDFDVIKLISNGAYGAVHLVKHRQTHERYAVKKISKSHLILRNQVEQAFVERDIMTFTDNPFVVALFCTFETKNHLCLVMEYVEGGDVATLLKNIGGPLNVDIARMYFAETTLAVEYLHSYGIIHRDLKPDNLLITAIGHIKLTDFGLSKIGLMSLTTNYYEKHLDKDSKTFNDKQICGTPSYIAPEVILRQGYGKAVDWWSMGIILYEFLVGIPPFTGNTPDELFANVIHGEIDWQPFTSDDYFDEIFCSEARSLIEQLLEHDPSKRLGTVVDAHEIRRHAFCSCINWNSLLREKADFVPVLESPEDTSYFDTREDRYQHTHDESTTTTDNESDSLFASFSSVSFKYASELSVFAKQRQTNELSASVNVSRTNSICSTSLIHANSISDDSSSVIDNEKVSSSFVQEKFDSDIFEAITLSSDESESSSKKATISRSSLSSSQVRLSPTASTDEKTIHISPTKHYKQRKLPLKLLEQQNSLDSGDDNQPDMIKSRHQKKTRIPRVLSPIKPKQSSTTPSTSITNKDLSKSFLSPSNSNQTNLSMKYNPPQSSSFSRSLSSSPSSKPTCSSNRDDRSYHPVHRHKMAVSPLERDTTLKSPDQQHIRPPIIIHRGPRSFGFTLRAVKVFHGNTDYYTTQHVVIAVEGPAEKAGLKPNDMITHVNEHPVAGVLHSDVVKLILNGSKILSIHAIPCAETPIRTGGRRRSPSKQKLRSQQQNSPVHHQPNCQKYRINSPGNPSNKKYPQNNSLFRRLSERKVARDIEAAAAAAGVPSRLPTACINHNPIPITSTATALSSSLPLLSATQSIPTKNERSSVPLLSSTTNSLDASEWLLKTTNEPVPTSLPSIAKTKPQVSPLARYSPVHQSLNKALSEPIHSSRQTNIISAQSYYSSRRTYYGEQTATIVSHKRRLARQKPIFMPHVSQSVSVVDKNLNRSMVSDQQDLVHRCTSIELSTVKCLDRVSSHSPVIPTRIFYRRK